MQRSVAQSRLAAVCEKMGEAIDRLTDEECLFLTRAIGGAVLRSTRTPPAPDFSKMTLGELLESAGGVGENEEREGGKKVPSSRKRAKDDEEAGSESLSQAAAAPVAAAAGSKKGKGDVAPYDGEKHAVIDEVVGTNADGIVVAARKSTHNRAAVNHALLTPNALDKLQIDAWRTISRFFTDKPLPAQFVDGKFEQWHRWNKRRK